MWSLAFLSPAGKLRLSVGIALLPELWPILHTFLGTMVPGLCPEATVSPAVVMRTARDLLIRVLGARHADVTVRCIGVATILYFIL